MTGRKRALLAGLAAAFTAASGTGWAIAQGDHAGPDRPASGTAPTSGKVAEGRSPSGAGYAISRIDPGQFDADPTRWFCAEIVSAAASTQGCHAAPDKDGRIGGEPFRPSYALLGSDRFFSVVAPEGVTAMEVRVEGQADVTAGRPIDAGAAGTLLVAVVGGPQVTSRDPSTSRRYELRLLGSNGETVSRFVVSDPGGGE